MKLPQIIGVFAPAPRSGKSTVAGWLEETHGYHRLPFAKVLKEMCRPLFSALGYSVEDIKHFENGDKKDLIINGKTVRDFYKTLGHEWGRCMIYNRLWITAWQRSASMALDEHHFPGVVADDMRYENEAATVRLLGGKAWGVRRPGFVPPDAHASEGEIPIENADFVIENAGTYDDLMNFLNTAWRTES